MADARRLAGAAVFTAFVAVATSIFSVSIPATNGYFNVGEVMVYTTALLMGPYIGAFAGGVGSALVDLLLAPIYAPGTLVIKGTEGFLVGLLGTAIFPKLSKGTWRIMTVAVGLLFGGLLAYVGGTYLSGDLNPVFGGVWIIPALQLDFQFPALAWVALGVIAAAAIMIVGLRTNPAIGGTVLAVLIGGGEMVTGYFLYETFALQLGAVSAAGEFPFNVAQALVGLAVAVPLSASIKKVWGGRGLFAGNQAG